ncbi:hypothetical protein [Alcaligenes sp. WGS1538]|uniref:hypothetical protein n=1 Tax=Alcaligenes sp. WGS1538 TaxID=3366811 RepID=UPI00372D296A
MAASTLPTLVLPIVQPPLVLERADVASCPLGAVGNLRFTAQQGGTARATAAGLAFSQARRALAHFVIGLAYKLNLVSETTRARHEDLLTARANSRLVGNVLGALTAPADDLEGQALIAERLKELAKRSQGKLEALKGGRESLGWYVNELTEADVKALRDGVLNKPGPCRAVLGLISSDSLRQQASEVLVQIMNALDLPVVDSCAQKPLEQVARPLPATPENGPELEKTLETPLGYEELLKAHDNSRLVSNLLGALAAPTVGFMSRDKIAERLMELATQLQGKLDDLKGRESLGWHVNELTDSDVKALRDGVLSKLGPCRAMLDLISPYSLRQQASQVLVQIVSALDQRLASSFAQKHLEQITHLLATTPEDGPELGKALLRLARDVDQFNACRIVCLGVVDCRQLDLYLDSLSDEQFQLLRTQFCSNSYDLARQALKQQVDVDNYWDSIQPFDMLGRIWESQFVIHSGG